MDTSNVFVESGQEQLHQIVSNVELESPESEWVDEEDDDDMDFEPEEDSVDQDADFFDPSEDAEAEFHGMVVALLLVIISDSSNTLANISCHSSQIPRTD